MAICTVCFRHCNIEEGRTGFCGGRICRDGVVQAGNYGKITALALDPIEKKPLRRFRPGEMILSVGSYGCNLRCPFCQNHEISWSEEAMRLAEQTVKPGEQATGAGDRIVSPRRLTDLALQFTGQGNMGIAFTYNEPMIGYEFVRDTARLAHEAGLVNVLVTNGTAEVSVLEEVLPFIDAMNIDLKGFTDRYYEKVLGGDRQMVMDFISRAAEECHVELTTLIVPGENDSPEEISALSEWIASVDPDIPLHLTRFFPRFHMTDRPPTDVSQLLHLVETAKENLHHVYAGNC